MKEKEQERLKELKKVEEELYINNGITSIAGIDEAGRGPLAGPVVVACVIMKKDSMIEGINDSKKVTENRREKLYELITNEAIAFSTSIINHDVIDEINILNATKLGVTKCIESISKKPELILIDALNNIDTKGIKFESIIKGDAKSYLIAAASIVAKVTRDRIMRQWDEIYPEYGFEKHKGYGTKAHIEAIKEFGLCSIHRRSFTKKF